MVFWGHAPNSQTRLPDMQKAMDKLDLMVVVDPYPTVSAILHNRKDGVYLLPASTQFETYGSVTASNRSLQWRDKVIDPVWESLPDHMIMAMFAKKFGFADDFFKHIKLNEVQVGQLKVHEPLVEDITREFNRGMWTIGYTGQSPERLKLHMANQYTFDRTTLQARGGPCDGDYYGLPWPSWGTPEMKHPGTPNLYDISKPVAEGGLTFRARFGVKAPDEWGGANLLAEGSYSVDSELDRRLSRVHLRHAAKARLGRRPERRRTGRHQEGGRRCAGKGQLEGRLSGGIQRVAIKHGAAPFGNAKARCVVWNFPDPVPLHREPLYTPRRDLLDKYATWDDMRRNRLPVLFKSIQQVDHSKDYPIILTSGRLVEYEGGGDESRSNPWLAELQQDMFVEINPVDANDLGIKDGEMVWLEGPEKGKVKVMAMVTERVAKGVAFMPFHFGGHFEGEDRRSHYPAGADPYVLGESSNTAQTYGYDFVTQMQETKVTLCKIAKA